MNLLAVLAARDAKDSVAGILPAAQDADAKVRMAAMTALAQLAAPEQVAGMLKGLLKAQPGSEREAAEKAVMIVCDRNKDARSNGRSLYWPPWPNFRKTIRRPCCPRWGGLAGPRP